MTRSSTHALGRDAGLTSRVGAICCALVMAMLLIAGLLKLADLETFRSSLRTWSLIPTSLQPAVAITAPAIEVVIAAAWFIRVGRQHWWAVSAFTLLLVYSVAIGAHLAVSAPPDCDCLALLSAHIRAMQDAKVALARNAVLMLVLLPGILHGRSFAGSAG